MTHSGEKGDTAARVCVSTMTHAAQAPLLPSSVPHSLTMRDLSGESICVTNAYIHVNMHAEKSTWQGRTEVQRGAIRSPKPPLERGRAGVRAHMCCLQRQVLFAGRWLHRGGPREARAMFTVICTLRDPPFGMGVWESKGWVTRLGTETAGFPLSPRVASHRGCWPETPAHATRGHPRTHGDVASSITPPSFGLSARPRTPSHLSPELQTGPSNCLPHISNSSWPKPTP